ncbi:hypothetical protein MTP04_17600 [Lysinibacillus sp. PLM2]|nr:hypothetical protein MTP04_17600 [Lysinibacillus sp. PLM2]
MFPHKGRFEKNQNHIQRQHPKYQNEVLPKLYSYLYIPSCDTDSEMNFHIVVKLKILDGTPHSENKLIEEVVNKNQFNHPLKQSDVLKLNKCLTSTPL